MAKTRTFSIFLLKDGVDPSAALEAGHNLQPVVNATQLPPDSLLYILPSVARPPWWREFFGIPDALEQSGTGAIVFVPSGARWLALAFGHVAHNLKPDSYVYDFGLKITLNSVERSALKSTDIFEPGSARRRRIQVPSVADLTLFDFDNDSSILKSLTGAVKQSRRHLFKNATGASNLRVSAKVEADGLANLCAELITIYESDEYKKVFPDIQSVSPVSDPTLVSLLDGRLVSEMRAKADGVSITVPDMINYNEGIYITFTGEGRGQLYDGAEIEYYYDYLQERGFDMTTLGVADLKKHRLALCNEDNDERRIFSIYRSVIFDAKLPQDGNTYHLSDGNWYKFDASYIASMREYLNAYFVTDDDLIDCVYATEGEYNEAAAAHAQHICLDRTSISPPGQTQVEPCDICAVVDGVVVMKHVKISTRSSQLSHLFNQGVGSLQLLKLDDKSVARLKALIEAKNGGTLGDFAEPVDKGRYSVRFCIITAKDPAKKSDNLPLFSRMSLSRALKSLTVMGIDRGVSFVADHSPPKPKKKQGNKAKAA